MTALTESQRQRVSFYIERAYRTHTMTSGGAIRAKTAKQMEIETREAHAVVDFAVDHVTDTYRAPAGLWDDLFTELLESGVLVRNGDGSIRHYTDPPKEEA